jgi:hypothetical protein
MNGRTSTLLRRYASKSDRSLSDLKREWNAMSNPQRAKARREMLAAVNGEAGASAEKAG